MQLVEFDFVSIGDVINFYRRNVSNAYSPRRFCPLVARNDNAICTIHQDWNHKTDLLQRLFQVLKLLSVDFPRVVRGRVNLVDADNLNHH